MDLSIIIVSWNVREYLARCLESIACYKGSVSLEVFVVDNASTDGTADFIRNFQFPISNFQFILNKKNRGFAAANNQAIKQAQGKYILLLNPDTEFIFDASRRGDGERGAPSSASSEAMPSDGAASRQDPEPFLRVMLQFMESHPHCGILGPKLLHSDGTVQPSVRRFPRALDPLLFSFGIARRYCMRDFDDTKASPVDQVMGACFLIRRELIDAIGMLDERFFIWFEEVDYCRRAKEAGWEVWYTPDASLMHHGGESFAHVLTLKKQWLYTKSLLRYFWKYHAYGAWLVNAIIFPFRFCIALFFLHAPR